MIKKELLLTRDEGSETCRVSGKFLGKFQIRDYQYGNFQMLDNIQNSLSFGFTCTI